MNTVDQFGLDNGGLDSTVLWLWTKRASPLRSLESRVVHLNKKKSALHVGIMHVDVPKSYKLPGPVRYMDSGLWKLKSRSCYCIYYLPPFNYVLGFLPYLILKSKIVVIPSISQMIKTDSK